MNVLLLRLINTNVKENIDLILNKLTKILQNIVNKFTPLTNSKYRRPTSPSWNEKAVKRQSKTQKHTFNSSKSTQQQII